MPRDCHGRAFAGDCSPHPSAATWPRAPASWPPGPASSGPEDGRGRGRAGKREAGSGPAATARAVVCPLLRTAEDAARGLVARGGADLRGERRGGDASGAGGGERCRPPRGPPLLLGWSLPGFRPCWEEARTSQDQPSPRASRTIAGGHSVGWQRRGRAGVKAPLPTWPAGPAPLLRLRAWLLPPVHTRLLLGADKSAALPTSPRQALTEQRGTQVSECKTQEKELPPLPSFSSPTNGTPETWTPERA